MRASVPAPDGDAPFVDVTRAAGIDFVHLNGARGDYYLCEIMGGGGAFVDVDADGWLDVFLVQSGVYGSDDPAATSRLYRNRGDGTFLDVTAASGAGVGGYGMGCAVGDYDGDGLPDLFVTRVGRDVLLHNRGDGAFTDESVRAGFVDEGYSSSAAWLDYDRDGLLDLYVARYIEFTPEAQVPCSSFLGLRDYCDPSSSSPTRDLLYRNLGAGRFEDVSVRAGIALRTGYGLAVACSDFDSDGWVDVYVANDQSPAFLWRNRGDGTFVDDALPGGCAYNGEGVAIAGMGIVAEDLDDDRDIDLFVTNIRDSSHLFLRNDDGRFTDVSSRWGNPRWMVPLTGFGAVAFDRDLDGDLELFVANGAVLRNPATPEGERAYAEVNQFLTRDASGRFVSAADLPADLARIDVARGLARGDYDDDGDVDLLVCRNGDAPRLLRNESRGGRWLGVELVDANGHGPVLNARVTLEAGARSWTRECRANESYLVSNDPRVHFGLGEATTVESVEVRWPDGSREWFGPPDVGRYVALRRGSGVSRERGP